MSLNNGQVTLVDTSDKILGYLEKLKAHLHPVPLHRAVSVLIFNGGEVLVQKRAKGKFTWPGFWSNTACTNVLKGETYVDAAKRCLVHELGIETDLKKVFDFIYKAQYDAEFGEHELDNVFIGQYRGAINANPMELSEYKWMALENLLGDMEANPSTYTPWFRILSQKLAGVK